MANMLKNTTLLLISLLLILSVLTQSSARLVPSYPKTTKEVVEEANHEAVEESCDQGVGDEECLMRRTLSAHIDYIYTQEKKP